MVLAASASYIAVPAAMRVALPQAQAGIFDTLFGGDLSVQHHDRSATLSMDCRSLNGFGFSIGAW